jgi:hypothetical protein
MARTFNAPAHATFDAWTSEEVMRRRFHAGHKARLGGVVQNVDAKNELHPWPKPVRRAR